MKAPKAPDPYQTADAQAGMNRDTGVAQNMINMIGQDNPWGSTSYSQTGTTGYTDSSGKWVSIPQFTQTTTFTPEQQAIFDQAQQAQGNLAGIASEQSERVASTLNDPFTFNNQDAADWSYDLAQSRIAPQQQQQEAALRARLVNSGIRPGTQAWEAEMRRMTNANTDQNNMLALQGRGQAFGEAMATRNQPLNELTALLSGSQVSNPAAMSGPTPQASVAGVDYTGLVNQQYQGKLANHQAMLGGLFGLAGAGASFIPGFGASDVRVKENVSRVGTLDNGLPVYAFRYVWGGPMQIGVMAQDVEGVNPDAVREFAGIKHVDYGKAVQ